MLVERFSSERCWDAEVDRPGAVSMDAGRRNEAGQALEQLEGCDAKLLGALAIGGGHLVGLAVVLGVSAVLDVGQIAGGSTL